MKKKLIVFAGKPGVGKTTIIGRLFPEKKIIDVFTFIEPFVIDGNTSQEKSMVAYQNMYHHLETIDEVEVILEIGTNYPELNILNLERLLISYDIKMFLCDLDKETCYQRAIERGMRHCPEAFAERMNRDFPNTFIKPLSQTSIIYEIVSMHDSLPETIEKIRQLI